jgi:ribonuclease-3
VLGYVISEELYQRFPEADEGSSAACACPGQGQRAGGLARELDLGEQLRLGSRGTQRRRAAPRSILADTLEAVIGAIVLDRGIEECREAS